MTQFGCSRKSCRAQRLATKYSVEKTAHFAFNMYDDAKLLPLSLLDSVLQSSPDPEMISAAYIIAQTDIRFLEEKYGRGALQRFMAAFREGATTEEAVQRVCGKSLTELELELRHWGRSRQRVFAN